MYTVEDNRNFQEKVTNSSNCSVSVSIKHPLKLYKGWLK